VRVATRIRTPRAESVGGSSERTLYHDGYQSSVQSTYLPLNSRLDSDLYQSVEPRALQL